MPIFMTIATFLFTFGKTNDINETYISDEAFTACVSMGTEYKICPEMLMAIVETESSGNADAENGSCKGLMQVSSTWHSKRMDKLGVEDLCDTWGNVLVGTDYLFELFDKYGDVGLVLDIYNGNANAWFNYENGITSAYAQKIIDRSEQLEEIHENAYLEYERRVKEEKVKKELKDAYYEKQFENVLSAYGKRYQQNFILSH